MRSADSILQKNPRSVSRIRRRLKGPLPVVLLLLIYATLTLSGIAEKSPGFDETAHIAGGYSYWKLSDYRLHPENGVFPQRWATLPLLAGGYAFSTPDETAWKEANVWDVGRQFLFRRGNAAAAILFSTRAMITLLGVVLCGAVYAWSRRLFGREAGLISLALAAFSPTLLSLGGLVTSDLAVALLFLIAAGSVWRMLHRMTPLSVLASSASIALLLVTKVSALLFFPMALLLVAAKFLCGKPTILRWGGRRRRLGRGDLSKSLVIVTAVHVVVAAAIIWAFYGFRYSAFRDPGTGHFETGNATSTGWEVVLEKKEPSNALIGWAREKRVLPEAFLYGYAYVLHLRENRPAFLNGRYSIKGWLSFFPFSFAAKTRLSVFAAAILAVVGSFVAWKTSRRGLSASLKRGLYRTAPLWVLIGVYGTFAVTSRFNIGHRHLAPIYPPLFVLLGAAVFWFRAGRRRFSVAAAGAGAILVISMLEGVLAWPHYLAYFNPIAGGTRNAYRHMVDSSLDWGMDLPGLKKWLDRNASPGPAGPTVFLSYFGTAEPGYYGIDFKGLPSYLDIWSGREFYSLTGGIYCVSATMLQCLYIRPVGPWCAPYEGELLDLRAKVTSLLAAPPDSADDWSGISYRFEELRFARLCAYLRHREPDDRVGGSILIYRLTDEDVRTALLGPPVELLPGPRVEGL